MAWDATDAFKLALDYRFIRWTSGNAYKKLGWNDQSVIALGGQYKFDKLSVRLGFNYGKSPLNDLSDQNGLKSVDIDGHSVFASSLSRLNAFAIPVIAQTHLSGGLGYSLTQDLDLNTAFVYVFENTRTFSGVNSKTAYSMTTKVSQWSASLGAVYRF
jgi:long-chain fatty acid transport protein